MLSIQPTKLATFLTSILPLRGLLPVLLFGAVSASAQQDIQYTGTNGTWTDGTNWVGGIAPGSNDDANFRDNGNGFTTLSVDGITISHLDFTGGSILGYTIGTGGAGVETFSLDGAGANSEGIFLNSNLNGDIIVDANINLSGAGQQYRFDNRDLDNDLIINGTIDAAGSGNQVLAFGNFTQRASNIILNGDVTFSSSSRLDMNVLGTQVTVNGSVLGGGNVMRTTVRDGGIITVSSTGSLGQGSVTIRNGQIFLNNTTTAQLFDDGLNFGNAVTGDGDSTLTIASGGTLDLDGNLTYFADDNVANQGTLTGGTVDLSGASRAYTINDNALLDGSLGNTEMTLSTNFKGTNSGTTNGDVEDFSIRGAGAITWDSTFSNNSLELVDVLVFENAKTVIATGSAGADFTNLRRELLIRQRDNADQSNFAVELDINGNTVILDDDLIIGQARNRTVASEQFITISDSADSETSKIRLTGDNDIVYHDGLNGDGSDGSAADNRTAFVSADLEFVGSNFIINVEDGIDTVDLDISGTITTSDSGAAFNFSKRGAGTLKLSATDNVYNAFFVDDGIVQITNGGALGNNDVQLGAAATDGTLEYIGTGETISNQFRMGPDVAANTGNGTILNNGTGGLTLSSGTFNQARAADNDRNLTLGGSNTGGKNTISGSINDNNGSTVSITKEGSNTWVLSGDNTYTGTTTVSEGTLEIGGTNASAISVAAGAQLDGEGTTTGAIVFAGTTHTINADLSTAAALGSTTSVDVSALTDSQFIVNVTGAGAGPVDVLVYGTTFTGSLAKFALGTGETSARNPGGAFSDSGSAIQFDAGFVDNVWANTVDGNWDISTTANWANSSPDSVYEEGDIVIFTDSTVNAAAPSTAQTVNIVADVAPGSVEFTSDTITYEVGGAAITGSGSLSKTGTAEVTLTGANTYTGGTTLGTLGSGAGAGITTITNAAAFGTGEVIIAGTNTELVFAGAASGTIVNDFHITSDGNNRILDFDLTGAAAVELTGNILLSETNSFRNIIELGNDTVTLSGVVSGTGGFDTRQGGTLVLNNGSNTFGSGVDGNAGQYVTIRNSATVQISSLTDSGEDSALGHVRQIRFGNTNTNGTLEYVGTTNSSSNRQVRIGGINDTAGTGSATINNNGSGTLQFTNANFNLENTGNTEARVLTLGGTNTGDNRIDGIIADNNTVGGGTISLVKEGAGAWYLNGANTYTGTTTVDAGTLGGTGSISGALTTVNSGATLTGGTDGTLGTFAFTGDLDMQAGSNWLVDLVQGTGVDLITVGGTLNLNDSNLVLNDSNFSVDGSVHNIASYSTLGATRFNGLAEAAFVTGLNGGRYQINYGTVNANFITLSAVPEPQTWAAMALLIAAAFVVCRRRQRSAEATEG